MASFRVLSHSSRAADSDALRPTAETRILDVGGAQLQLDHDRRQRRESHCSTPDIPSLWYTRNRLAEHGPSRRRWSRALLCRALLRHCYSNSVIEHLHEFDQQKRFADEVRRVGRKLWVQTPARGFFVEPHLITPFIHYLPNGCSASRSATALSGAGSRARTGKRRRIPARGEASRVRRDAEALPRLPHRARAISRLYEGLYSGSRRRTRRPHLGPLKRSSPGSLTPRGDRLEGSRSRSSSGSDPPQCPSRRQDRPPRLLRVEPV